jgi:glycosyltransferase involved in cell wall biosynthesis
MRILILNWRDIGHPKAGGAEAVTFEHARRWIKAGHTVTWFTAGYAGAAAEDKVQGIRMIRRGRTASVHVSAVPYLIRHGGEYDVVIDEIHGLPFFAPLFTKTPVVAFIHEVAGEIWDYMYPAPVAAVGKWIEREYFAVYRRCRFWTDAPSMVRELERSGVPHSRCLAISCPIPGSLPIAGTVDKETEPTFLFVSRLVPMKGIENVIEAFARIVRSLPDASLWIVGGGDAAYVGSLKVHAERMGIADRIRWYGKVDETEKYRLMSRAHILLHASVREGWGLVVLEAAAVGTPAVVYNVTGLRDVVREGKTGIVLGQNTPEHMADAAVSLYRNRKQYDSMRKNGIDWAASLTWDAAVKASLKLLENTRRKVVA